MDALNTLRAILVACAFVAGVMLAFQGQWMPATVMFVGIVAHLALFVYLRIEKRKAAERDPFEQLLGS